jgi:hypothetical protein
MDHACHRCGAQVSEGTPFCAQCGAPQIRVTPEPVQPPPQVSHEASDLPPFRSISEKPTVMWSRAVPRAVGSAVLMAIVVGVSSRLGSVAVMVLAMIAGGILSVWLYSLNPEVGVISGGIGARIGAITGFIAAVGAGLLGSAEFVADKAGALEQTKKALQQQVAANPTPQNQQVMDYVTKNPDALLGFLLLGAVLVFFLFMIFSTVGGALGAVIVRKK